MEYIYNPKDATIEKRQLSTPGKYIVRVKNAQNCECPPSTAELRHLFKSPVEALDYINSLNENRATSLGIRRPTPACRLCGKGNGDWGDDGTTTPDIQIIGEIRFSSRKDGAVREYWRIIDVEKERTMAFRRSDRVMDYVSKRVADQ